MKPAIRSQAPRVKVGALGINRGGQDYLFSLGSAPTDAQGRWRFDLAPKDLAGLWVRRRIRIFARATSSRRGISTA